VVVRLALSFGVGVRQAPVTRTDLVCRDVIVALDAPQ
jgi:hypothetical protein